MVRHGQPDRAVAVAAGEHREARRDLELDPAADETQLRVADQGTRQQAGLGQDLEAVAHAQHRHAGLRAAHDLAHHRAARRHGTAAQIVAIGEAAGNADQVELRQLRLLVPDPQDRGTQDRLHRHREVAVAVGTGKGDDRGAHRDHSARLRR